ncbi:MAG: ATP-dependent DNA helicase RecG [Candidatus Omnitrophota bacterium]
MRLNSSLQYLKGIGPERAKSLKKIGLREIEDLLYHFPRRYQDRSECIPIVEIREGENAALRVDVVSSHARQSWRHRRFYVFEATVRDETGRLTVVWFNQSYLKNYFKTGAKVILWGKIESYKGRLQMSNPEFEILDDSEADAEGVNRIQPFYALPENFSQRSFRKLMDDVLKIFIPRVAELLAFDIRQRHKLLNIAQSLRNIHFPENHGARDLAYQRLSFEEFFVYQIPLALRKSRRKEKEGIAFKIDEGVLGRFIESLPFSLTLSQQLVVTEIKKDMAANRPMQRLIQGDVGCGKTVVAMLAAFMAVSDGYQVAFMVPTEILAHQHYEKIKYQFSAKTRFGLLTSSLKAQQKKKLRQDIQEGRVDIVIGTHALLEESIKFKQLGLIVIDEQHKFGVSQRALLPQKGINPDVLIMTATPIPRTLSMTLYGDLDISLIRQMPLGPKRITTMRYAQDQKAQAYDFLKNRIKQGEQAFVVYPLIEDSPKLALASAKSMHQEFSEKIFKDFRVGLIHGKVSNEEQDRIMQEFKEGKIQVLVATTIVEVGIDVPQVSLLLIENAERFGLSQLHQIRGRIGRKGQEAHCLVVSDATTEDAKARLDVFVKSLDGFDISEEDLRIRGPGEFFGERQHGLSELRIANPLRQMHILKAAREEAIRLVNADSNLADRQNQELRRQLYRRFPYFEKFIEVG